MVKQSLGMNLHLDSPHPRAGLEWAGGLPRPPPGTRSKGLRREESGESSSESLRPCESLTTPLSSVYLCVSVLSPGLSLLPPLLLPTPWVSVSHSSPFCVHTPLWPLSLSLCPPRSVSPCLLRSLSLFPRRLLFLSRTWQPVPHPPPQQSSSCSRRCEQQEANDDSDHGHRGLGWRLCSQRTL